MCLVCFWGSNSFGQPKFQRLIGGSASDEASQVINTSDGGYATIGSTRSFGAGQSDILFIKYDSLANIQWSRTYGSPGNDFGTSCAQLTNGNFILAGYTYGLSPDTSYDDFILIRISAGGIVLWAKTAGGNRFDEASSIAITSDSYLVVAGSTTSTFQSAAKSAYAMKFDLSGNLKWAIAYHTDSISYFKSVSAAPSGGGIVFTGACKRPNYVTNDIYVVRADSAGTPAWSKRYGGVSEECGNNIKHLSTSELLVTGNTESYGAGASDAFLLKVDTLGNANWLKTYGTPNNERGNSLVENLFGLYIFCGSADSLATGISKVFMIRADSSGAMLNKKTFGDSLASSIGNSLVVTKDSGFVIAGKTYGFGALNGDVHLSKSDRILQTGCYQSAPVITENIYSVTGINLGSVDSGGTALNVTAQIITSAPVLNDIEVCGPLGIDTYDFSDLRIFPNPATVNLNINLSSMGGKPANIILETLDGKTIYSAVSSKNELITIPVNNFAEGLYFLQITYDQKSFTKKINIIK